MEEDTNDFEETLRRLRDNDPTLTKLDLKGKQGKTDRDRDRNGDRDRDRDSAA